jgi:hypothetical protein
MNVIFVLVKFCSRVCNFLSNCHLDDCNFFDRNVGRVVEETLGVDERREEGKLAAEDVDPPDAVSL